MVQLICGTTALKKLASDKAQTKTAFCLCIASVQESSSAEKIDVRCLERNFATLIEMMHEVLAGHRKAQKSVYRQSTASGMLF